MGDIYVAPGGGSADLDAVTAGAGDVLSGKTIVDTEGEPVAGTMPYRGAWTGRIGVNGRVAIPAGCHNGGGYVDQSITNRGAWTGRIGVNGKVAIPEGYHNGGGYVDQSIPNNGAQNATLNCGQSKTIPAGYTSGGTVTANSLASQTGGATADTSKVLSGYTFWRDGAKHTGILAVQSVVSFSVAQYSNLTLIASWARPSRGPWSGLRVMCKQGGYPSSVNDGTLFYEGSGTSATNSLSAGTWYFRAWNYMTTSLGRMYGGYVDRAINNVVIRGQKTFTSSGTFTIPAGVYSIDVFCVGGGGGGGGNSWISDLLAGGAGGGGGYTKTLLSVSVNPNNSYSVIVGSGGVAGEAGRGGGSGGSSSFGSILSASGGSGGLYDGAGGAGGSGGGGATYSAGSRNARGANGGADGSNGGTETGSKPAGTGQGTTTRAFKESSNTLYAGGGGSGGSGPNAYGDFDGSGGAGGGGQGHGYGPGAGAANTGGGGGGRGRAEYNTNYVGSGGSGGSGIVVVRWGY